MRKRFLVCGMALALGACTALAAPGPRAGSNGGDAADHSASPRDVKVVVTVRGQGATPAPVLEPDDVFVYENNQRRPVVDWHPASANEGGLDLAILMDDSLDSSIGVQWNDLQTFIRELPPATHVAVVYGTHGDAYFAQKFTTDHARAAQALRLPIGKANEVSSIYLSLADLLKHWPADSNRRAVLMISDGLDLFRGVTDSEAPLNPDLQEAIRHAQESGTTVFTLFANDAGLYRHNLFLLTNGQSCLTELASETGGESYFQGFETPVAFAPFLKTLSRRLGEQYVLTFRAQAGDAPRFDQFRVKTEEPGVKLMAPDRVFISGSKS